MSDREYMQMKCRLHLNLGLVCDLQNRDNESINFFKKVRTRKERSDAFNWIGDHHQRCFFHPTTSTRPVVPSWQIETDEVASQRGVDVTSASSIRPSTSPTSASSARTCTGATTRWPCSSAGARTGARPSAKPNWPNASPASSRTRRSPATTWRSRRSSSSSWPISSRPAAASSRPIAKRRPSNRIASASRPTSVQVPIISH